MIRWLAVFIIWPFAVSGDVLPGWSGGGAEQRIECAAIFHLLEPQEADVQLSNQFAAASEDLQTQAQPVLGGVGAEKLFQMYVLEWSSKIPSAQANLDLVARLRDCRQMTRVFATN